MKQNVRKIVLIDLDNTLLDNQEIRLLAEQRALTVLFPERAMERALLTCSTIIDYADAFEVLGFPNFRHYWSPVEFFVILISLNNDNILVKFHPELLTLDTEVIWADLFRLNQAIYNTNRLGFFSDKDFNEVLLDALDAKERLMVFVRLIKKILSSPLLIQAQREYDKNLELKPVEHVTRFLGRLQESNWGFYLVSEGLTQVQLETVSRLGLQEFFNGRILITQAAAEPFEVEEIIKAAKDITSNRGQLFTDESRCLDYLTLSYFYSLMRRWADKCNRQFYGRVLHSVQLNPMFPQDSLGKVEVLDRSEWLARPPIKVAMIGDRYDKDLLPILSLCGKENSLTIRVRQGRYKDMPHPQHKETWRSPTISFEDFSQVEEFIFDLQNWEVVGPIPWPKIFDEPQAFSPRFISSTRNEWQSLRFKNWR